MPAAPSAIGGVNEAAFQRSVLELATVNGWLWAHFNQTRREVVRRNGTRFWVGDKDAAGFPDCVFVRERVVYAELKGPATRVTDLQARWLRALRDAGAEAYLWRAGQDDDWDEVVRVLGAARQATAAAEREEGRS